VAVDGVDFTPYLRALLAAVDGVRIADRVVVITDQDPTKKTAEPDDEATEPPLPTTPMTDTAAEHHAKSAETGFNRAVFLTKHLQDWDVPKDCFRIAESRPTLEPELMRPENKALLRVNRTGSNGDSIS
jgi:putative ATP-dependent endonuclease of OLD family